MATYTAEQLASYLRYIGFDADAHGNAPTLACLSALMLRHVAAVPFDSLSLHYSPTRRLSLDPEHLYRKMVGTGRGGYCMEVNALFAAVLRTMGFQLITTGARVSQATAGSTDGQNFMGWNHMVSLVAVQGETYLVDVGFGRSSPCRPLRVAHVTSDEGTAGIREQRLRVYRCHLPQHTDPSQRVWVYSHRESSAADWVDGYAFTELEFFPADFEVLNLATMTTGFFVQAVICVKVILGEDSEPVGQVILINDELKRRVGGGDAEVLATLKDEAARVEALGTWFGITLDKDEIQGIAGLGSELKD